ncbi:hypothetical protein ACHAXT_001141 [Thalassiosira profunda]
MSKPAAKPRKSKRKASSSIDDSDASMESLATALPSPLKNLSSSKNGRKRVATALLSLLPADATKQNAAAKKLASAFPLVIAELEARSKALARANESEGTRLPIAFRFDDTVINMPEECFTNVLKFLKGAEVVRSSLVSKVWLSMSRMPALWERLDRSAGLTNKDKKLNMTELIRLLGRPQFENLKLLSIPYKVKLGKSSIKQIAKACPHLETFDIGYSCGNVHAKDGDFPDIAMHLAQLTSVRFDMWNATNYGIQVLSQAMGDQLLDLRIKGDCITNHYLSDAALSVIASSCSSLKQFTYEIVTYSSRYYRSNLDSLSGAGINALVGGCRCLEVLELKNTKQVTKSDFTSLLAMLDGSGGGYALREINLVGLPFAVKGDPFRIEDVDPRNGMSAWERAMDDARNPDLSSDSPASDDE